MYTVGGSSSVRFFFSLGTIAMVVVAVCVYDGCHVSGTDNTIAIFQKAISILGTDESLSPLTCQEHQYNRHERADVPFKTGKSIC